jgi:hypothetical protein
MHSFSSISTKLTFSNKLTIETRFYHNFAGFVTKVTYFSNNKDKDMKGKVRPRRRCVGLFILTLSEIFSYTHHVDEGTINLLKMKQKTKKMFFFCRI